jgi:hypothetical protein
VGRLGEAVTAIAASPKPGDSAVVVCQQCDARVLMVYTPTGWQTCNVVTRRVFRAAQPLVLVTLEGDLVAGMAGDITQTVVGWPLHEPTCQPKTSQEQNRPPS